jgi:hypothetical protein
MNSCEHAFPTIFHARKAIEEWRDYNDHRPHSALGGLTPSEFLEHHFRIDSRKQSGLIFGLPQEHHF